MSKREEMKAKVAKVEARYGKTLGASKGTKPAPPAKVRPVVGKGTVGIRIKKDF